MNYVKMLLPTVAIAALGATILTVNYEGSVFQQPKPLTYTWMKGYESKAAIAARIAAPEGFRRTAVASGSFSDWLRHLPLEEANAKVFLYNGEEKANQNVHHAVVDIDTGDADLQQCADAVMRLKAEYHYMRSEYAKIHFNFVSGDRVSFDDWRMGRKPQVKGNKVAWTAKTGKADNSYLNFKKYLRMIYSYAGTLSLAKELQPVAVAEMQIGDVFIKGGSPGHAVVVVDMVENPSTKQKMFLLAQSYMPAQDIHILKNPKNSDLSPWYPLHFGTDLVTPEWEFTYDQLKRFKN